MNEVIGSAVIQVTADARQLKAGIDDAKRSLKDLGIAAGDATKGQSASIDRYVKSLGTAAVTAGQTGRELELLKLGVRGASDAQLAAADSALKMTDRHKQWLAVGEQVHAAFIAIGAIAATSLIAAAAAFDELVKHAAEFQHMAEKIGDSAQAVASLAVAAAVGGTSMDAVVSASAKLTKGLTGVDDESKAAGAAIVALGLNISTFKELKAADQMEAVAKALAGFEEGTGKTAVAMALFGKAGAEMLPFLKELGAEGGRQEILTKEQIASAKEYADAQVRLRTEIGLQAEAIASSMLPQITELRTAIRDLAKDQDHATTAADLLKDSFSGATVVFQTIAVLASEIGFVFLGVGREIGAISAQMVALAHLDFSGFRAISDAVKADGERARAELDKFQARVMAIGQPSGNAPGFGFERAPKPDLKFDGGVKTEKTIAAAATSTNLYTTELQKLELQLLHLNEKTAVQQETYKTTSGTLKDLTAAQKAHLLVVAAATDKDNDAIASNKKYIAAYEEMKRVTDTASDASRDYLANIKYEASLIGKSADEQARMNEERKIDLALQKQLKEIAGKEGSTPGQREEASAAVKRSAAEQKAAVPDKLRTDATGQNIADVAKIRKSLMGQAQAEESSYTDRLVALAIFRDAKVENEAEGNRLIQADAKLHAAKMLEIKQAEEQQQLAIMASSTGQLYDLMKQAGMDQTALGKVAFIADKAIAIATILMNTEVGAAKALAFGPIAGPILSGVIRAMGYASAGLVAGMAIAEVAGKKAAGGPVDAGKAYQVNERGPELLDAGGKQYLMMGSQGGSVTPAGGFGGNGEFKGTIINHTTGRIDRAQWVPMPSGERALLIEEAVSATAAQWGDPNSKNSRALARNMSVQRSR